mmetsp:Transcript_8316/g.18633  ORF Transcript_8316/g.18633 Transcript_8316/m.18633 type:complete len:308 (-) Transcript_8316:264-1187(-)
MAGTFAELAKLIVAPCRSFHSTCSRFAMASGLCLNLASRFAFNARRACSNSFSGSDSSEESSCVSVANRDLGCLVGDIGFFGLMGDELERDADVMCLLLDELLFKDDSAPAAAAEFSLAIRFSSNFFFNASISSSLLLLLSYPNLESTFDTGFLLPFFFAATVSLVTAGEANFFLVMVAVMVTWLSSSESPSSKLHFFFWVLSFLRENETRLTRPGDDSSLLLFPYLPFLMIGEVAFNFVLLLSSREYLDLAKLLEVKSLFRSSMRRFDIFSARGGVSGGDSNRSGELVGDVLLVATALPSPSFTPK